MYKDKLFYPELLRIISIVGVILIHVTAPTVDELPRMTYLSYWWIDHAINSAARCSVPIFIMISGMFLLSSPLNAKQFYSSRFARILPLFLAWSCLYYLWGIRYNLSSFSLKALCIGILQGNIHYHLWFIYLLLSLYLLTPLLQLLIKNVSVVSILHISLILFATYNVSIICGLAGIKLGIEVPSITGYIGYFLLGYFLNTCSMTFVWRAVLYNAAAASYLMMLIGHFVLLKITPNIGGGSYFYNYRSIPIIIIASAIFVFFKHISIKGLSPRVTKIVFAVSAATYSIYLSHIIFFEFLYEQHPWDIRNGSPIFYVPIVTLLVFLCSYGCYVLQNWLGYVYSSIISFEKKHKLNYLSFIKLTRYSLAEKCYRLGCYYSQRNPQLSLKYLNKALNHKYDAYKIKQARFYVYVAMNLKERAMRDAYYCLSYSSEDSEREVILGKIRNLKSKLDIPFVSLPETLKTDNKHVLPQFLIIGTQKGGTTSLYNYLIQHPNVHPAVTKEVHYFDEQFQYGMRWYLSHFPEYLPDGDITGEATPYYFFHPHAPKRVHRMLPLAKIIIVLRNPIDRAFSHYQMMVNRGVEKLSFPDAIRAEESRINEEYERMKQDETYFSTSCAQFSYLTRGLYCEQLDRWHAIFPNEQILILRTEQLQQRTAACYKQVLKFLGLSDWDLTTFAKLHEGKYDSQIDPDTRTWMMQYFEEDQSKLTKYQQTLVVHTHGETDYVI